VQTHLALVPLEVFRDSIASLHITATISECWMVMWAHMRGYNMVIANCVPLFHNKAWGKLSFDRAQTVRATNLASRMTVLKFLGKQVYMQVLK
jgi:NhaP-type Na+/H+ and K+/H+ antiporter